MPTQAQMYYLAERRYGEMLQDFRKDARAMVERNPRWQWMLDWCLAQTEQHDLAMARALGEDGAFEAGLRAEIFSGEAQSFCPMCQDGA